MEENNIYNTCASALSIIIIHTHTHTHTHTHPHMAGDDIVTIRNDTCSSTRSYVFLTAEQRTNNSLLYNG